MAADDEVRTVARWLAERRGGLLLADGEKAQLATMYEANLWSADMIRQEGVTQEIDPIRDMWRLIVGSAVKALHADASDEILAMKAARLLAWAMQPTSALVEVFAAVFASPQIPRKY